METGYQRGKIQEGSMFYEHKKHDDSYAIIGVNTVRNPHGEAAPDTLELARSTDDEKQRELKRLVDFHNTNKATSGAALTELSRSPSMAATCLQS